jgi:hypothetical protein
MANSNKIRVELRPCPFCGGTCSAISMANGTMVSVGCDNVSGADKCGARMSRNVARRETLQDCAEALAAKWNARISDGAEDPAESGFVQLVERSSTAEGAGE